MTDNGREPHRGQCDCCGKTAIICRTWSYGIETYACAECHGYAADDFDYMLDEAEEQK